MKTRFALLTFLALCSLASFAAQAPKAAVTTALLKCTPTDTSLFQFTLSETTGCVITPGGKICDFLSMSTAVWDEKTHAWAPSITSMGMPKTAQVDKTADTFSYHYESKDKTAHIDVEKKGDKTTVDIKENVGGIDTHGEQTNYQCTLL